MSEDGDPSTDEVAGAEDGTADDLAWRTLDTRVAYTCPGFDVREDRVRLPDGTAGRFHAVSEPASVVVLPFTAAGDGEVVVIEEWRQAVGRVSRGLPAGGVEPGDADLAAAAHRELTEETGYVAGAVEPLVSIEPLNGLADAVHHYHVARDCRPDGEQTLDHNESIEVATTTFDALRTAVRSGTIRDGRTVLGVLFYDATRGG